MQFSLREAEWQLVNDRHLDPTPGNSESVDLGGPQHISVSPAPQMILTLSQSQRSIEIKSRASESSSSRTLYLSEP